MLSAVPLGRIARGLGWRLRGLFEGAIGAYVRTGWFRHSFRRSLMRSRPRAILDAGCGRGDFAVWVARQLPQAQVRAVDLAVGDVYQGNLGACRRLAREAGVRNLEMGHSDLRRLEDEERYDLVYSVDAMEHIPGNRFVLRRLLRALRPGGLLYLAMPWEAGRRRLFPARFFREYDDHMRLEHIGEQYSLPALSRQLEAMGFCVLEGRYSFGPWGQLAWELDVVLGRYRPAERIAKPLLKLMGTFDRYWPNARGNVQVLARRPAGLKCAGPGSDG